MIDLAMEYPASLGGWLAVAVALVALSSAVGGIIMKTGSRHIDERVRRSVHAEVPAVVTLAMREVNTKLDGIRINQMNLSAEIAVVRRLEVKIDNGLTSKVRTIEDRQTELVTQIAEMHGWMQATHQWDGDDRRDG